MTKIIGILGMHGSREEHEKAMQKLGYKTRLLRTEKDFDGISGIILPGGESTSFGRLLNWSGVKNILTEKIITEKIPTFGTCAGAILLAQKGSEFSIGAMDIDVDRNAYGRQIDSFSSEILIKISSTQNSKLETQNFEKKFKAIFIRAPKFERVGGKVKVLATEKNIPVLVQDTENKILAASFHPELTKDLRVHQIFADMIEENKK